MEMKEWARREIDIMIDNAGNDEFDLNYSSSCGESALKAFNSLMEDGHSGMSISVTMGILNRLVKGQPLTPIYDDEEAWEECSYSHDDKKHYQCRRMSSLFKDIDSDCNVTYSDVDRVICVDIDNPNNTYMSGLVRDIINEMFPITMPYYPGKAFKITCHDILTDAKNGDFDTVAIFGGSDPDGNVFSILRYFKEAGSGWEEITEDEYLERCKMHEERLAKLQEEQKCL